MRLLADVLAELDRGHPVVLATVIATGGSTPRHPGARMAICGNDRILGTIGGGRIEVEVIATAREVLADGTPRRVRHHLVRDLAMCCGGWMELVLARPARAAVAAAVAAWQRREPALLITGCDDGALALTPADAATARAARRPAIDGGVLREGIAVPDRAILFGHGHVTRALGPLLAPLGFEVIVCDDGDTGALEAPPPWAARVIESFAVVDVERALGPLGDGDHLFIVTRDHAVDQRLLEDLLDKPVAYLGMIGSRGKVGRFKKRLAAKGLDLSRWPALHAPIGLDLGAETPAEIAIAIAAELVALRRRGEPAAGSWAVSGHSHGPDEA